MSASESPSPAGGVGPIWAGLLDDAATFPPGNAPIADAIEAYGARRSEWYGGLIGSFVVKDTDLSSVPVDYEASVVVTGGAGAVAGALRLAQRRGHRIAGVEIALRDLDDLPGNARRVVAALDAARDEGLLSDTSGDGEVPAYVEIPGGATPHAWLSAADEVAAAELRLKFRTGGLDSMLFPTPETLASWIDGALDRETPFKCTAGLHNAVRHVDPEGRWWHHGFLNVLLATLAAWDGAGRGSVEGVLAELDPEVLAEDARGHASRLATARRWFTSFGTCSIAEPRDDLIALSLLPRT